VVIVEQTNVIEASNDKLFGAVLCAAANDRSNARRPLPLEKALNFIS
jgi:hypothetical protein